MKSIKQFIGTIDIDENRITVKEVEEKVDFSLFLFKQDFDILNVFGEEMLTPTLDEVRKFYNDFVRDWSFYLAQLLELEEYEICNKIKRLLELEYNDCMNILKSLNVNKPELILNAIRNHYNEAVLNYI